MSILKGACTSLGLSVLLGSSAIAAPLFPNSAPSSPSNSPAQTDDQKTTGDVVVETEPRTSDSTKPGSTTGSTTTSGKLAATRFTCENQSGQFVVMYHPESQPGQAYPWATPGTMGGGWTPERRCNEISRRLETYRPDGLQEMRTGLENGYNTVCVTTERVPGCRIVLTVPSGQDPTSTRDRVFQNLTVADGGQQTQAVNTFVDNGRSGNILDDLGRAISVNLPNLGSSSSMSDGINLRPFLDRADGGTGAYLRGGAAGRPAPRLNPDRFR